MSISIQNSSVVTTPAVAPSYDQQQQNFLSALAAFKAALLLAEANPNNQVDAVELELAGANLASAQKALAATGVNADTAMNNNFEALTLGDLDTLIKDCAAGNLVSVENDDYGFSTNPGEWNNILQGLSDFSSQYPTA